MNIGQFFEQHRGTHAAQRGAEEMKQDPFTGLSYMADEMSAAADAIRAHIQALQEAKMCRKMGEMNAVSILLQKKVQQLAIMANSMMLTTATHKARGVK